jgi:hypothetical protein
MYQSPPRPGHRSAGRAANGVRLAVTVAVVGSLLAVGAPAAARDGTPFGTSRSSVIPDSAMLQPEDLHGHILGPAPDDLWPNLRPPQPCADAYPSTRQRRSDRAISGLVGVGERPTVVVEEVAVYRSNGARRYLRDLRRALRGCGGVDEQGGRWTVLDTRVAGRDSLLLRLRQDIDYGGPTIKDTYLAVARVGRALVVVADVGWEDGDGHEALVRELITAAVRRASTLR